MARSGSRSSSAIVAVLVGLVLIVPAGAVLWFYGGERSSAFEGNVMETPARSVSYLWYDMFNVPFSEWWYWRNVTYHIEEPITDSYPYLFEYHLMPPGNDFICSNMRLNIVGRNMTELNMASNPELLPFLGSERGGNATIDWYMQYLTSEEMKRFPEATAAWNDGWVVSLNGTVTLDRQAAKAVLGINDAGFDNFASWWAANGNAVERDYSDWFYYESGKDRLDIYPMYDTNLMILSWNLNAARVGDLVVLDYDLVTWGMEALMTRWLHESFMPTEHYFEDFSMRASIGPEMTDIDIETVVAYALTAYETILNDPGNPDVDPCWVWEATLGDYVPSSPPAHPHSDFDPYADEVYVSRSPGSLWYGNWVPYTQTPGAFNLAESETLTFEWPTGPQLFKVHQAWGATMNVVANMTVRYSEPMESDFPSSIELDTATATLTFAGPIDMWNWSRTQDAHQWLVGEWARMGILPYGVPYVEFRPEGGYLPPLTPDHMVISLLPVRPVVNTTVSLTVTVYDQYGFVFSDFNGTVSFTSDRPSVVTLPPDYVFTPADRGTHTYWNMTIFHSPGYYNLTAMWTENGSVSGSATVFVIPQAPRIDSFEVEVIGGKVVSVEQPLSLRVTAYDQYGLPLTDYLGTVNVTTNAPPDASTCPAPYTFKPSDHGVAVVSGLVFHEVGVYNVTVFDQLNTSACGTLEGIVVTLAPAVEHRIYDMFEQPWGDWWWYRLPLYGMDIILSNISHEYTMVWNPDQRGYQSIIYAPYRWNTTAWNLSRVTVHHPEFMPVLGTPNVSGARAETRIYFEYISDAWWYDYWVPTWSGNWNWSSSFESVRESQHYDGYYIGVVYDVLMNREAAEEWLGMPQTGNPLGWWNTNRGNYMAEWQRWIRYEGNVRLDIWPGYEWPYIDIGTMMDLVEEPDGSVRLSIGHISWGFEVLMARWLNESGICAHQPWFEDFHLSGAFEDGQASVTFDAVAQYNLHAVRANGSSTHEAAWVWEPMKIDYVPFHGSEYNPWENKTYTSWNSGDMYMGQEVRYEYTPAYFNLPQASTLIIQLPVRNSVIGYLGEPLPYGTLEALKAGDKSAYDAITVHGPMWLGYWADPFGSGPDLSTMCDNVTKTLTMTGPLAFDNFRHGDGRLYHGAPWIEFNVGRWSSGADYPPVANAGPDQVVMGGLDVLLNGTGSYDDKGIVSYVWTFVYDGSLVTLYGPTPTFIFWIEGTYNITLAVSDALNRTAVDRVEITVSGIIPEFQELLLPVLGMLAAVALAFRARGKRGAPS